MMVFRLPNSVREALQKAAVNQHRSLSNMTFVIVSEWLKANGYLASGTKASVAPKKRN